MVAGGVASLHGAADTRRASLASEVRSGDLPRATSVRTARRRPIARQEPAPATRAGSRLRGPLEGVRRATTTLPHWSLLEDEVTDPPRRPFATG